MNQLVLQRNSSSLYIGKALPDIDYKKPKFNVFMQNDIFTKCIDPADYLSLKELKEKASTKEDDEVMSENTLVQPEEQESPATNFEEDYYHCIVAKPKSAADYPYIAEDDIDMLNLIPEQNEPVLYELVNKVHTEKKRKQYILDANPNMR